VFLPEDTSSEQRGMGLMQDAALRVVRLTFDLERRPESELVIGEVVHLAGRWSSYPPHHHGQPELYHYRFTEPQGYGHAELGDDVVKVKQFDTVKITGAVDHPQVAAPGYGMYYLWIVRHEPGAAGRYTGFTFADEHKWMLDGKAQGWAPKELK
jgi:5-deoxy-glucuronate isomerase